MAAPAAPLSRRAPPRRAARRAASNKGDAAISIRSAPCWGGEPHCSRARGAAAAAAAAAATIGASGVGPR